jgi:hypothetical protein
MRDLELVERCNDVFDRAHDGPAVTEGHELLADRALRFG